MNFIVKIIIKFINDCITEVKEYKELRKKRRESPGVYTSAREPERVVHKIINKDGITFSINQYGEVIATAKEGFKFKLDGSLGGMCGQDKRSGISIESTYKWACYKS